MLYLVLAVLSSAVVSLCMRLFGGKAGSEKLMFTANYAVCTVLSLLYRPVLKTGEGFAFSAALGVLGGALYLLTFLFLKRNISKNGVVLSSTFMKMGVLVPTLMAVTVFREKMSAAGAAGFVLAVAAILVINGGKGVSRVESMPLLIVLLLSGGVSDALAGVQERLGNPAYGDVFLFATFLFATVFSAALAFRERNVWDKKDVLIGAAIGLPNYYSARFQLLSLRHVPAVVAYPVTNTGVLVLLTAAGVLFFGEKLTKRKALALVMILAALILLNL